MNAAIVGGSIVGCATAQALLRAGVDVVILERSETRLENRGQGLVLPADLVARLKREGFVSPAMPAFDIRRRLWTVKDSPDPLGRVIFEQEFAVTAVSWSALYAELLGRVPGDRYMAGRTVRTVADEFDGVRVEVDDGETLECDFVVACDGYRSTLRGICFPDAPLRYSGYVIWRGWFDERAGLLDGVELIAGRMNTFGFRRGHGNLWVIPGAGSAERGDRQVAWNLYDPLDGATFQETLRERDGSIRSVPPGGCTPEQLRYLNELAERALPRMVADAIAATPAPLMSPIFDLRLRRLTKGRVALLGDAGMVLRPVTGSGATKGLQDALALGEACGSAEEIDGALARYDAQRRPVAQALVELGVTMGEALVTEAPDWPKMSPLDMTTWHQRMMAGRSWYALDDGARLQGSSPSR